MFGPDTELIFGAIQMSAVIAAITGGAVYLAVRKPWKRSVDNTPKNETPKTNLEERVEVLERIATDRSIDLADEIEALRDDAPASPPKPKKESA